MADETKDNPITTESIPSHANETSAIASASAPIIFTDWVGTYGVNQDTGIAHVSLEVVRHMPVGPGAVSDRVIVAHLRMPMRTLRLLKDTIEKIELMTQPTPSNAKN
ncbi:hypothetical protein [Reyranella sp.]|uniref:hypothetical protein n=1 Tax=Reyranella sp. TaxID=1929291 RepID=UPI003D0997B9